ncbi:MAG: CinA family protein [Mycoplasmataceae bacterium]|jgi:nicotinamide-nucleotide amidase|nr:CinA family protein [Mycoplasmataceae bacterium]
MSTFVQEIVEILKNKHLTLSTCESVTGGMIGSHIVNVSGVSKVYLGGIITYSNESKIKLANVVPKTLDKFGAISKETALEMAVGVIGKFKSDVAISITGNAGPISDENKQVGMAYVCICVIDKTYTYEIHSKETERNQIRIDFTFKALSLLLDLLKRVS